MTSGPRESDDWRPVWQKLSHRNWDQIRDSWIGHIPALGTIAEQPDPGLTELGPLMALEFNKSASRHLDVDGLRANLICEALFLFHKCSHTILAAQRLARSGMHSWCQFNAYHSAYLGARGIMSILGVAFPSPNGKQAVVDLFPEPEKRVKRGTAHEYHEFIIFGIGRFEQRRIWEAFLRILNVTKADCWNKSLLKSLRSVRYTEFSPPRNAFLYKPTHWPMADLASDSAEPVSTLVASTLQANDTGFLLAVGCAIYRLFEDLVKDLATLSPTVERQLKGSRCVSVSDLEEIGFYNAFLTTHGLEL